MGDCLSLSIIKSIAEIAAFGSAAVFFAWKAASGFMYVNLGLEIDHTRSLSETGDEDYLVPVLKLRKGNNATLRLDKVQISVTPEGLPDNKQTQEVDLSVATISDVRNLNLPPGDETQFSWCFRVPHGSCCHIEAVVRGKTLSKLQLKYLAEWKASEWAVPIARK